MIDLQALKEKVDMLAMAQSLTGLKKVATTGGGEYAGPCPWCGGRDRFRVQPNHQGGGRWMCRQCSDKWQDAIAFVMRRDSLDFKSACAALGGGDLPTTNERRKPDPTPVYDAPADDWQAAAWQAIRIAKDNLAKNERAIDYLLDRGIGANTWEHYELGYSSGFVVGDLRIQRGILIPCIVAGEVWYLKIALLPEDLVICEKCRGEAKARKPCPSCGAVNKYRGVKGNRTAAIFGAGNLSGAKPALFCEGEFDVLTAWQELSDLIEPATLGAATNRVDLAAWGLYLLPLRTMFILYDPDKAGAQGVKNWQKLTTRAKKISLPAGVKDVNDYYQAGGDLRGWMIGQLERLNERKNER